MAAINFDRAELGPYAIPKPSCDGADRVSRGQLERASEVNEAPAWVAAQGSSERVKRLDTRESPDCSASTTWNFRHVVATLVAQISLVSSKDHCRFTKHREIVEAHAGAVLAIPRQLLRELDYPAVSRETQPQIPILNLLIRARKESYTIECSSGHDDSADADPVRREEFRIRRGIALIAGPSHLPVESIMSNAVEHNTASEFSERCQLLT